MAAFIKNPNNIGAGPLIVILTEVISFTKLKPEYNFLASSKQQTETPAFTYFSVNIWTIYQDRFHIKSHYQKQLTNVLPANLNSHK